MNNGADNYDLLCPFPERKAEVRRLSSLCRTFIGPTEPIRVRARHFHREAGLSPKDALHLACAVEAKAGVFLTCDDDVVNHAARLKTG